MSSKIIWRTVKYFLVYVIAALAFYWAIDLGGMSRYLALIIGIGCVLKLVDEMHEGEGNES